MPPVFKEWIRNSIYKQRWDIFTHLFHNFKGSSAIPQFKCRHGWTLQWRHNELDGVWNHRSEYCLLSRLFRRRPKKTSKLRVTGLCGRIHRWPLNSPYKGLVTRKMFPFDDVIMHGWKSAVHTKRWKQSLIHCSINSCLRKVPRAVSCWP